MTLVFLAGVSAFAEPSFDPSPHGGTTFAPRFESAAPLGAGPAGGTGCSRAIPGFSDPGAIVRGPGSLLFVGNAGTTSVKVIDARVPGAERVRADIPTPLSPIDLAVVDGRLYVIDQGRDLLQRLDPASGQWSSLALPNGQSDEWDYGNIIAPHGGLMYVLHMWEDLIDVVDLASFQVVDTISQVDHLPDRVAFDDGKIVVLGVGLDAPSCAADGPNFAVFDEATRTRLYRRDLPNGECALTMTALHGTVYVSFDHHIEAYALADGALLGTFPVPDQGRNLAHDGYHLVAQTGLGATLRIDLRLRGASEACNVLDQPRIWYPPLEEMVAMSPYDGRTFVTNRNDGTVSIRDFTPCVPTPGSPCGR